MNSFPRSDVIAACQKYGAQLRVDSSLNPAAVAYAMASNESSLGANCGPRHEPAYDVVNGVEGPIYRANSMQRQLVASFGQAAASSFGPWQMMFINFDRWVTPAQLLVDLDLCGEQYVKFFNRYVIDFRRAVTLNDIGQIWNGGHVSSTPSASVQAYCDHLQEAYGQATV